MTVQEPSFIFFRSIPLIKVKALEQRWFRKRLNGSERRVRLRSLQLSLRKVFGFGSKSGLERQRRFLWATGNIR